ncbi:hypothetical protein F2P81_021153 [Scophthalmus maximus]|uniref:Uncharacterized protein n=1 Tax=Scophthalmus maximus TaxID=52904 RepID=A0A6A4RUM8_SCOMX|nr:hypothetical protein F2P81_021153 [Scophthalmus maximus]
MFGPERHSQQKTRQRVSRGRFVVPEHESRAEPQTECFTAALCPVAVSFYGHLPSATTLDFRNPTSARKYRENSSASSVNVTQVVGSLLRA